MPAAACPGRVLHFLLEEMEDVGIDHENLRHGRSDISPLMLEGEIEIDPLLTAQAEDLPLDLHFHFAIQDDCQLMDGAVGLALRNFRPGLDLEHEHRELRRILLRQDIAQLCLVPAHGDRIHLRLQLDHQRLP